MTRNEQFLKSIYQGESVTRSGFTSTPKLRGVIDHPFGDYTVSDKPISEWVGWAVENYQARVTCAEAMDDDTVPIARLSTGTQVYAAAFGCEVATPDDTNPFALPKVYTPDQADALEEPDIWKTPELYRVFELARLVQIELGPDAWLGPCDMQTGFDIAALIWNKADLFVAMTDPESNGAVHRLIEKCANLLETFLVTLRDEFPQMSLCGCPTVWSPPDMGPWPSNDECGAVGTPMFEEYMLPELIALSRRFGSVGMHCCAAADHQMDSFRKIPNFYAFNRVAPPGSGPEGFDPAIQTLGGPDGPVFVLGWMQPDAVEHVLRNAPDGTRFIFQQAITDIDEGKRNLERMYAFA